MRPSRGKSRTIQAQAVALLRAEELPATRPDLGWTDLFPRLEIEVVPGDHLTCVTRHVGEFGERLEALLQRSSPGR